MSISPHSKIRLTVIGIFIVTIFAGFLVYPAIFNGGADWVNGKLGTAVPHYWNLPFRLGLDLQGGTHLVYGADVSQVDSSERAAAVEGVRDVIERRVNAFGVAEPLVQTSGSGDNYQVVVELAGVRDVNQAIKMIGETPLLEFKEQAPAEPLTADEQKQLTQYNAEAKTKAQNVLAEVLAAGPNGFADLAKKYSEDGSATNGGDLGWAPRGTYVTEFDTAIFDTLKKGEITKQLVTTQFGYHVIYKEDERTTDGNPEVKARHILIKTKTEADIKPTDGWQNTALNGQHLKQAQVTFDQGLGEPQVALRFNDEGNKLFAQLTGDHVGQIIGIFLDGEPISLPRVNEPILNGEAVITGNFTLPEAKLLAQRLNAGALPVPITLLSQQTVGASLGRDSLQKSLFAGLIGLLAIAIFMTVYYRLPGLISVIALLVYGILVLTLFKLVGITLSLAGIAGFILSIGMAVDANVLIFERMKEEMAAGRSLSSAIDEGFHRAWPSIRDGNVSTLITCAALFWFSTSMIKGFALTLSVGILVSMFTAITVTRGILKGIMTRRTEQWHFLFSRPRPAIKQ